MIQFSTDTIRELNRMMYTLYKFFSVSLSSCENVSNVPFTTADQIHLDTKPHDYYNFNFGSSSIRIHQIRTHYTIECCGYVPSCLPMYKNSHKEKYRNTFGEFDNLDLALNAFYMCCKEFLDSQLGALF